MVLGFNTPRRAIPRHTTTLQELNFSEALGFSMGLVGRPVLPTQTKLGCPNWWNARLREGGSSVLARPGFWRTFHKKLQASGTTNNGKRIVVFRASEAFAGAIGTAFAIVDWTRADPVRRVLALGHNPHIDPTLMGIASGDPAHTVKFLDEVSPAVDPDAFPNLFQQKPHEYGQIISVGRKTFIADRWSRPAVAENGLARRAGLRPPERKPTLVSMEAETEVVLDCSGTFDVAGANVVAEVATAVLADFAPYYDPGPAFEYQKITVDQIGTNFVTTPVFTDAGGAVADGVFTVDAVAENAPAEYWTAIKNGGGTWDFTGSRSGDFPGITEGAGQTVGPLTVSFVAGVEPWVAGDKYEFVTGLIASSALDASIASTKTISAPVFSGVANGRLYDLALVDPNAPLEEWTVECFSTKSNGRFRVTGSISGPRANAETQAPPGDSYDNGIISFKLETGPVGNRIPYKIGDKYTFKIESDSSRLRFGFMLVASDAAPGAVLPAGTLAIGLSTSANLFDPNIAMMPIDRPIQSGLWYRLELPFAASTGTYTHLGIFAMKPIPASIKPGTSWAFAVDEFTRIKPRLGPFKGKWAARFTWYDPALPLTPESDPSPPSNFLDCGDIGIALKLECAGFRGYYDLEANAFAGDPVGVNFSAETSTVRVWLTQPEFGEGTTGEGNLWLLASPPAGVIPQSAWTDDPDAINPITLGDGSLAANTDIVLDSDLTQLEGAEELHPFKGELPATELMVLDRNRLIFARESDFSAGLGVDVSKYFDIAHLRTVGDPVFTGGGLDDLEFGGDYSGLSDTTVDVVIDGEDTPDTFKWRIGIGAYTTGVPITGDWQTLAQGVRVRFGATTGHTEDDTWAADLVFARWSPAFVGRKLRIYSGDTDEGEGIVPTQAKLYQVRQYIDAYRLRIGAQFNGETEEYGETYNGASGLFPYRIVGAKNSFRYTTHTALLGARQDYCHVENEVSVDMPNDEIHAIAHAGEYLLFFGRQGVYRTLQDRGVLDETGLKAYPRPEPIHGAPGIAGPRLFSELPGGEIIWLSPDWKICRGNAASFGYFEGPDRDLPVSVRIKGWIRKYADAEMIQHAHAVYDAFRNWWLIFFVADDGEQESCGEEGASYDLGALSTDFNYGLIVDLNQAAVYPMDNIPITTTLKLLQPCPEEGTQQSKIFGADPFGYIYELQVETARANGVPQREIRWDIANFISDPDPPDPDFGPKKVHVSRSDSAALFTTGDGLKDLYATLVGVDGTTQVLRIESNTGSILTFYDDVVLGADANVVGGVVHLGLIHVEIDFKERQFDHEAYLESAELTVYRGQTALPSQFQMNVFTASNGARFVDRSAAATFRLFNEDELNRYDGRIYFVPAPAKALQLQLGWDVQEGEAVSIEDIQGIGDTEIQGVVANYIVAEYETHRRAR